MSIPSQPDCNVPNIIQRAVKHL